MAGVESFNPPTLAPAHGFAHATRYNDLVWIGGQISSNPRGEVLFPGDLTSQFGQAIRNVEAALIAAGTQPRNVLKITYLVTDVLAYRNNLRTIGEAYRQVFGYHYPAATLFQVQALFEPSAMIEIECVATRPEIES